MEDDDDHHNPRGRSTASVNLSKLIGVELNLLEKTLAMHEVEQVIIQIKEAREELEKLQGGERIDIMMELQELKKAVGKLKSKVPFNLVTPDDEPNPDVNRRPRSNRHKGQSQPIKEEDLEDDEHPTSEDLISFLDNDCLLAESLFLRIFMLFPGKAILKLSLLACWEEVLGLGEPKDKPELHVLVSKGIIKPVFKTSSMTVSGFRMHPFVRSTLSAAFSKTLDPPQEWKYHYLVNSIEDEEEDVFYDDPLDFSAMKHLKFLHLGKWQKSSAQHIEMEDPELYFKNMKRRSYSQLRYISFRGISMIKELPKVLNRMANLNFLDLRACYHLEAIPSDIGHIWKCLTHLDMSECYFLDHMPASLSRLRHLCVLKGFYVGEATNNKKPCTLQDLSSLRHLWKLNIYTSVKGFPNEDQLTALHGFVSLRRLTVSWGGCSARREECKSTSPDLMALKEFSFQLEKLDLQCVPNTVTRHWLKPSNFQMLKKLYIRGGEFNDLGGGVHKGKGLEEEEESWSVEILRLKHLGEMQMDWSRLVHLFPKLVSLEKVECPHLTGFPCDKSGLWMKTTQKPPPIPIPTYTHGPRQAWSSPLSTEINRLE